MHAQCKDSPMVWPCASFVPTRWVGRRPKRCCRLQQRISPNTWRGLWCRRTLLRGLREVKLDVRGHLCRHRWQVGFGEKGQRHVNLTPSNNFKTDNQPLPYVWVRGPLGLYG